jgi:hypothetical protein
MKRNMEEKELLIKRLLWENNIFRNAIAEEGMDPQQFLDSREPWDSK